MPTTLSRTYARKKCNREKIYKPLEASAKALIPAVRYNLSLEPSQAYSLGQFADKGEDLSGRTSKKLHDQVLYFETNQERYEVARVGLESNQEGFDQVYYRLSQVLEPEMRDNGFMARA